MDSLQGKLISLLSKAYEELQQHLSAEHIGHSQSKPLNEAMPRPKALKTERQETNNSATPFPFSIAI